MNKKIFYGVIITALLVLNIVLIGLLIQPKEPGKRGPKGMREGPKNIIIQRLGFDQDQIASYEALIEKHQVLMREKHEEVNRLKNELYQSLSSDSADETMEELTHQLGSVEGDITKLHVQHFRDIKALCTSSQIEKYNALTKEFTRIFNPRPAMKRLKDGKK